MTQIQNLITPKITIIADIITTTEKEVKVEIETALNITKEAVAEKEKEVNTEGVIEIK